MHGSGAAATTNSKSATCVTHILATTAPAPPHSLGWLADATLLRTKSANWELEREEEEEEEKVCKLADILKERQQSHLPRKERVSGGSCIFQGK